jgi:hypothetical protein
MSPSKAAVLHAFEKVQMDLVKQSLQVWMDGLLGSWGGLALFGAHDLI